MTSRTILVLVLLALAAAPWRAGAEEVPRPVAAGVRSTAEQYGAALRAGDCAALERHLMPEAYRTYQTLCEQNRDYPQFLRHFYGGSTFRISDIRHDGAGIACTMHQQRADGDAAQVTLRLRQDAGRKWRIAEIAR